MKVYLVFSPGDYSFEHENAYVRREDAEQVLASIPEEARKYWTIEEIEVLSEVTALAQAITA